MQTASISMDNKKYVVHNQKVLNFNFKLMQNEYWISTNTAIWSIYKLYRVNAFDRILKVNTWVWSTYVVIGIEGQLKFEGRHNSVYN